MASTSEELGKIIGSIITSQQTTSQNISGESVKTTKRRIIYEDLKIKGTVTLTKKVPLSDSFIIDHPVQGEIDSAVYKIDGGYDATKEEVLLIKNV